MPARSSLIRFDHGPSVPAKVSTECSIFLPKVLQAAYRLAFVRNCMILIVHARERLAPHSLATAEEPHITGELVRSAKVLLESTEVESWMEHIEVLDDPPQNAPNRYGKKRPRIDIEFVTTGRVGGHGFSLRRNGCTGPIPSVNTLHLEGCRCLFRAKYAAEWPSAECSATCNPLLAPPGWSDWPLA